MEIERQDSGGESPAAELLGRRVLGLDPGSADLRVEYSAGPEFSNRHGTLSGGFLAAMLDSLLSLAAARDLGEETRIVTSELRVSFERPGRVGTLRGHARVEFSDERSISSTGELVDEEGKMLASGAATHRVLPMGDVR